MDLKNLITNIIAIISVIIGAVNAYIQSIGEGEINWFQLAMFIIVAIIGWYTGKNAKGSAKTPVQVAKQTDLADSTKVK